jgi:tRNA wybutosine-synthesizing protein 2
MAAVRAARGTRRSPADRVRARIRSSAGPEVADRLPDGYQRLGRVLVLRLPPGLSAHYAEIGRAWQAELGVRAVLVRTGPITGELREPTVRQITGGETETEVTEHGVRWRFDATRVMFAAGNRTERVRIRREVRPGERVVDLFAGIGYFAIPAARADPAVHVTAVEKNPVAHRYLMANAELNGVTAQVECVLGDNREVALPRATAHRVILGYLPDSTPWVGRALEIVREEGGWIHVHRVVDARDALERARREVEDAVADRGGVLRAPSRAREVKPYGPGRTHVVVDVRAARAP